MFHQKAKTNRKDAMIVVVPETTTIPMPYDGAAEGISLGASVTGVLVGRSVTGAWVGAIVGAVVGISVVTFIRVVFMEGAMVGVVVFMGVTVGDVVFIVVSTVAKYSSTELKK